MSSIATWWRYLARMTGRTMSVWCRTLPKMLLAWTTGWLLFQMSLTVTAPIQETLPWLAIILFSMGLVALLAGIIIGIRLAGEPAGLWEKLPSSAARIGRDEPLPRVVSIALLPFVGVYSVFGGIDEATYTLFVHGARASHYVLNPQAATTLLDPQTAPQRLTIIGVLVVCYVLRRGLEMTADRTGRAVFGLAGALVEGFFSVVLVFSASRMIGDFGVWLRHREAYGWFTDFVAAIADLLAALHLSIPEVLATAWRVLTQTIWPLLTAGVVEPMLWLAVAGLVFGTYILSVAELWEIGAERGAGRLTGWNRRLAALEQRGLAASSGSKAVTLEFFEMFVGDLEDRIVPFIQSVRHVLRVGVPFTAAYLLLYALAQAIQPGVVMLAQLLIGGREFQTWDALLMPLDLLGGVLGEPIRMSLLAVAMTLTVRVNQEIRDDQAAVDRRAPGAIRAEVPSGRGRRTKRLLPLVVLAVASMVVSGLIVRATDGGVSEDHRDIAPEQWGELMPGVQVWAGDLQASTLVIADGRTKIVTKDLFLAVTVSLRADDRYAGAIHCRLHVPTSDGGASMEPVLREGVSGVNIGFQRSHTLIFERPADGLVGARLHCQPTGFYLAYEAVAVLDLGIDEALAAELAAQSASIEYSSADELVVIP